MNTEIEMELNRKCRQFRNDLMDLLYAIQTGHPGGSLSCTEILTTLYFNIMKVKPDNPKWEERDRLILSKGHAAPMRAIPGMTVVSVAHSVAAEKAVFALADYEGPVYLRLSRAEVPAIYDKGHFFEIGKGVVLKEGIDVTLIATGTVLYNVMKAAELLEKEGIRAEVVDIQQFSQLIRNY